LPDSWIKDSEEKFTGNITQTIWKPIIIL